jgi:RNA polymerase sigma-70 factor, ECF subfamily
MKKMEFVKNREQSIQDSELIKRALDGDEEAFRLLYERYRTKVYGFCLGFVDAATAEDLTQETFLVAFRKLHTFRGDARFSTWLYRVTANVVFMRHRRDAHRVQESVSLDEDQDETTHPDYALCHDGRLLGVPDRLSLEQAIASLPSGYSTVFRLHDVYGYQHDEIAAMLNCSIGNTKSQLHKARLRLRKTLAQNSVGAAA